MYSRALLIMVALLILRAAFTPSTYPLLSTTSGSPFAGLYSLSRKRTAGIAFRRPTIQVFKLVLYRRSIVVWAVLGRPEGPTGIEASVSTGVVGPGRDGKDEVSLVGVYC